MEFIEELIDVFLQGDNGEMSYALNRQTGEILLDAPEELTGESEIDWDDEEVAAFLVAIPQITSTEAFDIMVSFAEKQDDRIANQLVTVLNGRRPFRSFKDKLNELGVENQWYVFESDYAKYRITEWLEGLQ